MADNNILSIVPTEFFMMLYGDAIPVRDMSGLRIFFDAILLHGKLPNLPLLEFLLDMDDINRIDKIDVLEMAGAIILGQDQNHEIFPLAFQYWRRALTLRLMDTENCCPIHKTPLKSKSGQLSEWTTLDDLQCIEQQSAQRKIQSLLVRLRIFGGIGWRAVYRHFIVFFLDFLVVRLPLEDSISDILDLTWSTLDIIRRLERPHENSVVESVIKIVTVLFINFLPLPIDDPKFNSENLMKFVELVLMMDSSHLIAPNMETPVAETRHMKMLLSMLMILSRHSEKIPEEVRLSLIQLVHRDGRDPLGFNLLHIACLIPGPQALLTIRFLVNLGAGLNTRNNVGDGVLHLLSIQPGSETRDATARLLVELGTHLDMVNKEEKTAADLWFQKNTPEKRNVGDLPDWLQEDVPNLQCLSARVIRRHKLPYDDGAIVPAVLIPFVSLH